MHGSLLGNRRDRVSAVNAGIAIIPSQIEPSFSYGGEALNITLTALWTNSNLRKLFVGCGHCGGFKHYYYGKIRNKLLLKKATRYCGSFTHYNDKIMNTTTLCMNSPMWELCEQTSLHPFALWVGKVWTVMLQNCFTKS